MSKKERGIDAMKSAGLMLLLCAALAVVSIKMAIGIGIIILLVGALWDKIESGGKEPVDWYSAVGDAIGIIGGVTLITLCDEYIRIL